MRTTHAFRFLLATAMTAAVPAVGQSVETDNELHPIAADVASQLNRPKAPFVMIVTLKAAPGKADGLIAAMDEPTRMTRKEEGNVTYLLTRSAKDSDEFYLFERWKSVAALDEHLRQPYLTKLLSDFDSVLAEPPTVKVAKPVRVKKKAESP